MNNILLEITESTKKRVTVKKLNKPFELLLLEAFIKRNEEFIFEKELRKKDFSFICEIKKASPSKGIIAHDFDYISIAQEYEAAGASAISILTEPEYFMGNDTYLTEIEKIVNTPILRKDFIIDEYQIYESKILGADAILLICSILKDEDLFNFINAAHNLGISALVETHTKDEIDRALSMGAKIIGINNRDLQTFKVDINNTLKLREFIPEHILCVSESGITNLEDIKLLKKYSVNAVLIGELLMREQNKINKLQEFMNA